MTTSPPDPVLISWSGLKRWERCPQHHLRVIRHETEKQEKGRIFLPGTVCDLAMRRWLENPVPGLLPQMTDEIFTEVVNLGESKIRWKGNPVTDQQNVRAFCRETVTTLEPWLTDNVLPYDYAPEVKFKAHLEVPYLCEGSTGPVTMIGGIDIVVRDDQGKYRLYDLKTTKDPGYLRSTLGQLTFYDLAWGVIQGDFYHAVDWGFVVPALPEKIVTVAVGREDRQQMLSRVVKYAQGVWRDEWQPKADDEGCGYCEARRVCDKFHYVATLDANGKQRMSFQQNVANRTPQTRT